nr:PREDICTED: mediator of RNA polymerase II transcription subunit 13 isoform X2 [Bemisia tabaci]
MTHQNHQTNGASLEDCHTNFFALTDLCGIKWRKCIWGESGFNPEPLQDPVLASFSKCLAADILCVWRRVGAQQQTPVGVGPGPGGLFDPIGLPHSRTVAPPLSLLAAKELWIFWYGEEPDLSGLVAPELLSTEGEQGSWESGLSYECRSLLFKALHNLIERCLLSRDFVRLGKWFVQPYDGSEKALEKSGHLSFSFAFFVHGESTVCASIDVRQHPPVRSLTKHHLSQTQAVSGAPGVQVILAPFGLSGTLTGQTYKALDPQTHRLMEDWKHFYPINVSENSDLPLAVEVLVGNVKLRYPSCYVLVTDLDESTGALLASAPSNSMKTSSLPSTGVTVSVVPHHQHHPDSMVHASTPATELSERVWQDCLIGVTTTKPSQTATTTTTASTNNTKQISSNSNSGNSTSSSNTTNNSSEAQLGHWDFSDATLKKPCSCSKHVIGSYNPSGASTPHHGHHHQSDSLLAAPSTPSVGAPSPLTNPHSVPQPSSVPSSIDPTMPTLSPQHPTPLQQPNTPSNDEKVTRTPTSDLHGGPKSVSSVSNQVFSPYTSAGSLDCGIKMSSQESIGGPGSAPPPVTTSAPSLQLASHQLQTSTHMTSTATPTVPVVNLLKRPVLSSKDYESALLEEEVHSQLLYDYSTLDAWLNHPVKRFKPAEPNTRGGPGPPRLSSSSSSSLYNNPYAPPLPSSPPAQSPVFIKSEPGLTSNQEEDKKDFEITAANEPKCPTTTADSMYITENTTFKDLDRLFDNSDDTSSDETLQVPTPPGSNKPAGSEDGGSLNSTNSLLVRPPRGSGTCGTGILRPEELSKMFPTPPSLEHNPNASPCGGQLSDTPTHESVSDYLLPATLRIKQETYPDMGSPPEEPIEDWSYVFRPPTTYKFVGSSKYAPLLHLPSHNLPPVTLPTPNVYKPSYMFQNNNAPQQHHVDKSNSIVPSIGNITTSFQQRNLPSHPRGSPAHFPPSPMNSWHRGPGSTGVRTPLQAPPPYSPATPTAGPNSYHNKNINSVEPAPSSVSGGVQNSRTPEANSLIVNILLGDTLMNIFRDHNFDSCTLCVCNAELGSSKVVGNIRGADAAVYLPQTSVGSQVSPFSPGSSSNHHNLDEDSIRCSCGFSAVVNRRLSHRAGLFYEDELEITGVAEEPVEKDDLNGAAVSVMDRVREQCVIVHSASNALLRAARLHRPPSAPPTFNLLEFTDNNQVTIVALEQGRLAQLESSTVAMCKVEEMAARQQQLLSSQHCVSNRSCIHRWPFLRARGPRCNQDIIRVMKTLQPLLQDAIQKKCTTRLWDAPYTVSGPLTWRQFHRLAGRGADDRCEPQPIPSIMVGHEKDWLSISPYAVQYWEKLLLEPYCYTRDIAYIVVAPDNEYILQRTRSFFKELSSVYEVCRLGRHCPITKVLRDGILRVGKSAAAKLAKEPVDEWFTMLGESHVTSMLKLYAQVCRHYLAPQLSQCPMDRTLLDPPEAANQPRHGDRPAPSPMPPPNSVDGSDKAPSTPKSESTDDSKGGGDSATPSSQELNHDTSSDEEGDPPAIVIYLVEPFTIGADSNHNGTSADVQRLACLGLLRCFNTVLASLPENINTNISLQIISLESIVELGRSGDRKCKLDDMRALAMSVFSQCRRYLSHTSNIKALTGFGTAAMTDLFLKNKDEKNKAPYKVYTPPYILTCARDKTTGGGSGDGDILSGSSSNNGGPPADQKCSVLYVCYCLSEDQRWLLASATDEQGILLDTATINIHIPNRSRRRKASARRLGLQKLMDFILGVMSQSVTPWRLIIGRVGRIGHGELKGWSWLLSRKSLLEASKHLKEICSQCSLQYPTDVPSILSACLVSLEPDSALRLMPDQFTPDERFSQASVNCQLSTPEDVSCTHILVFPTSATTQSSQTAFQDIQHGINTELGDDELFSALNDDMPEGMTDFNDIFGTWTDADPSGGRSPNGSPRGRGDSSSQPGSPMGGPSDDHNVFPCNGGLSRGGGGLNDVQEEVGALLQQPLALGYLVSTAPVGKMPRWFWSACPHLESVCPTFLKSALHMHTNNMQQNQADEILQQQTTVAGHPLDSQITTDVLRYVLEGYNTLSWLAMDSNTHDRLSCLPVHMQVLMQLYYMTSALV